MRGNAAMVHLLVADIVDPYFAQIAHGVTQAASSRGLTVGLALTGRSVDEELRILHQVSAHRPRGIIFAAGRETGGDEKLVAAIARLQSAGTRVVTLGHALHGARCVPIAHRGGAAALARALVRRGYRRAEILAGKVGPSVLEERVAGFHEGFAALGGDVTVVRRATADRAGGRATMQRVLDDRPEPGLLVFSVTDAIAVGAASRLRESSYALGGGIALAGFGGTEATSDLTPGLTTVGMPLADAGAEALRAVDDDGWAPPPARDLEIILRGSTPGLG